MITANDIKTKGVRIIEENLNEHDEVLISVHGKPKYAVLTIEQYDKYRSHQILIAYAEIQNEIERGDFVNETAQEHMDRLWKDET